MKKMAAVQKYANLVELEKCCQTHIFLQKFVLIQPRTSPTKNLQNFANFARSSLFNAILFVVSERFSVMRHEDRRAMLHEGAGQQVLTAFVEIVFDSTYACSNSNLERSFCYISNYFLITKVRLSNLFSKHWKLTFWKLSSSSIIFILRKSLTHEHLNLKFLIVYTKMLTSGKISPTLVPFLKRPRLKNMI